MQTDDAPTSPHELGGDLLDQAAEVIEQNAAHLGASLGWGTSPAYRAHAALTRAVRLGATLPEFYAALHNLEASYRRRGIVGARLAARDEETYLEDLESEILDSVPTRGDDCDGPAEDAILDAQDEP